MERLCINWPTLGINFSETIQNRYLWYKEKSLRFLSSLQLFLFHNFATNTSPVLGVLVFLPRKFLEFWHFLPRSWQIFLARFARFCKIIQDRAKKSKKIFRLLGKKTKNNQDFAKRNKKILHQSNTRFIDILKNYRLKLKKGYSCVCFYLNLNFAWPKKWRKNKLK